jgi:hypothetical protein
VRVGSRQLAVRGIGDGVYGPCRGFHRKTPGKTTKIISVFPAKNISVDK